MDWIIIGTSNIPSLEKIQEINNEYHDYYVLFQYLYIY